MLAAFASAPVRAQQPPAEEAPAAETDQPDQKPKAKPRKPAAVKPAAPKPAATAAAGKRAIVVNNGHGNALVILSVTPPGASDAATVVLLRDLPAKTKATAALPASGCVFDVYGRFEDDSTIGFSKLDLCKDRALNIVD